MHVFIHPQHLESSTLECQLRCCVISKFNETFFLGWYQLQMYQEWRDSQTSATLSFGVNQRSEFSHHYVTASKWSTYTASSSSSSLVDIFAKEGNYANSCLPRFNQNSFIFQLNALIASLQKNRVEPFPWRSLKSGHSAFQNWKTSWWKH